MSKKFPTKLLFLAVTLILSFSTVIFGQENAVKNDLKKSFGKFNLIRLSETSLRGNETQKTLYIPTSGKNYELLLTPRDLRSPGYRAEDTTAIGVRELEKSAVTTFRGNVSGEEKSQVRLQIDSTKIEGYFVSNGERFFIEPAVRYSKIASADDLIVYKAEDFLRDTGFNCELDIAESIEDGKKMVATEGLTNLTGLRVVEIATEADFEYVNSVGNALQTNNKILGILNMVEGVYENEINLTIRVTFQHTYSAADPFNGANSDTLLRSFQDYWNTNYPLAQYPRDAAHLFTFKPNVMAQGYAFLNVICNNPSFAYGLSGRVNPEWNWEEANFLITAHEIGHNLGANHAEAAQSCANTLMNAQLGGGTQLSFCTFSRGEISGYLSSGRSCVTNFNAVRFDFEGDGKADVGVFRPSNGVWYISQSSGNFNFFAFGANGDKPVAADYDGDGKTDGAVFRNGIWYRLLSSTNTYDGTGFGVATDIPAPGDFDGDGKADLAVFRPSTGTWFWLNSGSGNSFGSVQFGASGDVALPADYDGDGKSDINVFRPSNGVWYRLNSSDNSFYAAQFGANEDKPVIGDFDGDAKADLAIFRPSNGVWYVLRSSNGSYYGVGFGLAADVPTPADFDGDGKTDISVFRPSAGTWFRLNSADNSFTAYPFGQNGDMPPQVY